MATKKSHIVGSADLTLTVNIPADLNLIQSDPKSGQYKIKTINKIADGDGIEVVHSSNAEA